MIKLFWECPDGQAGGLPSDYWEMEPVERVGACQELLESKVGCLHATPAPVTLHINGESRAETLKYFSPAFDVSRNNDGDHRMITSIHIDFETDIIYMQIEIPERDEHDGWLVTQDVEVYDDVCKIQRLCIFYFDFVGNLKSGRYLRNGDALEEMPVDVEDASITYEKAIAGQNSTGIPVRYRSHGIGWLSHGQEDEHSVRACVG